jgi:signal transduction histidine kinase
MDTEARPPPEAQYSSGAPPGGPPEDAPERPEPPRRALSSGPAFQAQYTGPASQALSSGLRRYLPWILGLLALAIPALVIYTLYDQSRVTMMGLYRDPTQEPSVVTDVMPSGPAAAAGLQAGDLLLSVNGAPFEIGWDHQLGKTYTLEIERNGQPLTVVMRAATMLWVSRWLVLSATLVALAFWGTGTLVLWRRWSAGPPLDARLLFLSFQAIALPLLPGLAYQRFQLPPPWMIALEYAGLFLAAPLYFHYHITFPVRLGSRAQRRWLLGAIWGLGLLAAGISLPRPDPWNSPGAYYVVVVGAMALGAIGFVYLRRASPEGRRQLRVVIAGTFLGATPPLLGFVLPTLLEGCTPDIPRWVVSLFLALIPASYLYATAHHNLFGIDRLLNRTLIYAILSLGLFALYVWPLALLCRYLPGAWLAQAGLVTAVTLVVGLTFDGARKQVQKGVDTLFYGGWYDYPGVVETVSDALARGLEWEQLAQVLGCQVPDLMHLEGAQLQIGERDAAPAGAPSPGLVPSLSFPLTFEDEVRGLWIVGPRRDGEDFSASDRRILQTVARQAEVALNKVLLIERLRRRVNEIRAVQQQLLRSREEERARLARDLHDEPIQALVGLNLELGLLMATWDEAAADPSSPVEALGTMRAEVQDLLSALREVCAELRPPMLDTLGLGAALRALVEEWPAGQDVAVDLEIPPDPAIRQLPEDVAVNLYRVVQEALANVARHAMARRVSVRLARASPGLTLTIRDDGHGFDVPDDLHDLATQGHFGLAGMAERATLIGGRWMVESAPGEGTTLRLIWPEA